MGRKFSFSIPGSPRGKARPRFTKSGRAYTPAETVEAERTIATIWKLKYPREKPLTGPVLLRFTAVFAIPKSFNAIQRQAAMDGKLYATCKPDFDNLAKLLCDSLNGIAFADDAQVMGGGMKRYGEPVRVDVTIEELHAQVETPSDIRRRHKAQQPELVMGRSVRK